jgi:hypothetical protein
MTALSMPSAALVILAGVPLLSDIVLAGPLPLRAELDEVRQPARRYSRRPRVSAAGIEVIATRQGDAVVCALCRRLVEVGHDPALPLVVYRGVTLALRVRSIGEAAGLTVKETGSGPRLVPYQPFGAEVRSAVEGGSLRPGLAQDALAEGTPMSATALAGITHQRSLQADGFDEV